MYLLLHPFPMTRERKGLGVEGSLSHAPTFTLMMPELFTSLCSPI
jgi:hypothetical protein